MKFLSSINFGTTYYQSLYLTLNIYTNKIQLIVCVDSPLQGPSNPELWKESHKWSTSRIDFWCGYCLITWGSYPKSSKSRRKISARDSTWLRVSSAKYLGQNYVFSTVGALVVKTVLGIGPKPIFLHSPHWRLFSISLSAIVKQNQRVFQNVQLHRNISVVLTIENMIKQ